ILSPPLSRPPTATLFPYTTLFRSGSELGSQRADAFVPQHPSRFLNKNLWLVQPTSGRQLSQDFVRQRRPQKITEPRGKFPIIDRSEEHTSELQSLAYLVCRLLLEK